jgi:hypothetical protein
MGHTLTRGHGGTGHAANVIEDWWDTCLGRGGRARGAILTAVWWFVL